MSELIVPCLVTTKVSRHAAIACRDQTLGNSKSDASGRTGDQCNGMIAHVCNPPNAVLSAISQNPACKASSIAEVLLQVNQASELRDLC
jgi:hypothetical protein